MHLELSLKEKLNSSFLIQLPGPQNHRTRVGLAGTLFL